MRSIKTTYLFLLISLFGIHSLISQQLAFPGAEGFGRYTTGGRGGQVYVVTNLNDSGEGSLRKGILRSGPRIIVFAVSGTIELQSELDINKGDLSILGQTAPGNGITLKGYPVTIKSNNIIIRYLRFRMGDINGVEGDALGGRDLENVIIDHCSMSWATDENASFYHNDKFTMQWCIISEALNRSVHHKGAHGYGGIWGGEKVTFHHNLIASNNSRNPRFSGSETTVNKKGEFVDFRNNVIYNWGMNSIYGGEKGTYNIVNNYFKAGPSTPKSKLNRIVNPSEPYGRFYVEGNYVEGFDDISKDNWAGGVQCDDPQATRLDKEVSTPENVDTQSAIEAYRSVLKSAGSSLHRDSVDIRLTESVKQGRAEYKNGIIDSQENVGGWPDLGSVYMDTDTDKDGIPDKWEEMNGTDPDKKDAELIHGESGYSNIEIYANSLINSFDFTVAKDGTGDFNTVQDAVNAVPDFRKNKTRILIKKGVYKEKLVLPASKTNVVFTGEDKINTIITYDDYAQKLNRFGEEIGTTGSSSFFVFGDGFTARNLTFENSAGPVGQAVAVRIDGDRVVFENCRFLGNQDTLYVHGKQSRQYYKNCYIEGTVDFIFGWSTAYFENCEIRCKQRGYVTAASTEENAPYGLVFNNCRVTGDGQKETFYLGRPWRDHAKTVWLNCYLGEQIKTEGWHNWNKPHAEATTYYAEYKSYGPGASATRVSWAKQLNSAEAEQFTKEKVLNGNDNWNP